MSEEDAPEPYKPAKAKKKDPNQAKAKGRLPEDLLRQIQSLARSVRARRVIELFWETCSASERELLLLRAGAASREAAAQEAVTGDGVDTAVDFRGALRPASDAMHCWVWLDGTVGMYRALHPRVSHKQAVLHLAELAGLLAPVQAKLLRQRLTLIEGTDAGDVVDTSLKPRWDRQAGKLFYGDVVVREVRQTDTSTMTTLLDAFQEAGWPPAIANPLENAQALHEANHRLNDMKLSPPPIRFRARDRATYAYWERLGKLVETQAKAK